MNPIVSMKGIRKEFATVLANNNVDFDLYPGETHALVGENGAGKTTLMRILYGQYHPTSGTLDIDGVSCNVSAYNVSVAMKLGIGMVHQNFMQIESMSVLENIIMAKAPLKLGFIDRRSAESRIRELLTRFNMAHSPNVAIRNLCVGERQKIEIIKALYLGARVLILDEPTAVLTPQETNELFQIIDELKKTGTSIVFISHKLREVIRVGDRITVMRKGEVVAHFNRGEADETDVARAMIGKQDVQLLQNRRSTPISNTVCEVKNLWFFDGGGIARVRNLSMQVRSGEILGIGGVEGNGQSELIDLLVGLKHAAGGQIVLNGMDITTADVDKRLKAGIGYISEDRMTTGLALQATLDENLVCGLEGEPSYSRLGAIRKRVVSDLTEHLAEQFDIRGVGEGNDICGMSGGNLQKIVLARAISREPKLLIAAQPTRGLDIGAINFVRSCLLEQKERGTAIILVSADLEELMSLSDRMLILFEGSCSGEVTDVVNVTEESIGLMMGGITGSTMHKEV